jgi:hypothetical protein
MQCVRREWILIRRQFIDDAPLLTVAFAASLILLLAIAILTFVYPINQMLHMICVLVILPCLVGIGMLFLGVAQTREGGGPDELSALSLWPVTVRQLTFARIVAGMTLVLVIVGCLGIAVSGAAFTGLVEWPESLLPEGLVDLFVAMLLIGLACYGLGFLAGRHARSSVASLLALPLAPILASLVIIKGLGGPLTLVLVPFIAAFLVYAWTSGKRSCAATLAAGFMVMTLIAIPFYWARYSSDVAASLVTFASSKTVEVRCHHEFAARPRSHLSDGPFVVRGAMRDQDFPMRYGRVHSLLRPLGIIDYLQAKEPGGHPVSLNHFGHFWGNYYDQQKGLFVRRDTHRQEYVGPEGVSNSALDDIGRFLSPVVCGAERNG